MLEQMTPSDEKKPLPITTKSTAPSQPTNFGQWQESLQAIRMLYYRRRWKECIDRCNRLMHQPKTNLHPVHACSLHFYCALSNELLARSMHNLSLSKPTLLLAAKESYEAATELLPKPDQSQASGSGRGNTYFASSEPRPHSTSFSDFPSPPPTPTPHSRYQLSTPSSPLSSTSFSSSALKPSPLRIHKTGNTIPTPSPSSRPLFFNPSKGPSSQYSFTFSTSTENWLQFRALERYNAHLRSFAEMLENHISTAELLIAETQEIQAQRYTMKRLATYGNDEATKVADRRDRIKRLKARGWKRDRFQPERCVELCARALAEL